MTPAALERASGRLTDAVAAFPEGLMVCDRSGHVLYESGAPVVVRLRPEGRPASVHETVRVSALGSLRVEGPAGPLTGDWLEQRAGELLRYLVCERRRIVPAEVIAEAIWPHSGPLATNTVRHFVHALRDRLEPGRARGAEPRFVICRKGGYGLDPERVWIDADEFERLTEDGMAALAAGDRLMGLERLERATELYSGDLLADDPYAEWALLDRERLRAMAGNALRALAELHVDDPAAASAHLERLAELEPFDNDVQRQLITALMRLGRRSRAARHYESFRVRLFREFGERPDFELCRIP